MQEEEEKVSDSDDDDDDDNEEDEDEEEEEHIIDGEATVVSLEATTGDMPNEEVEEDVIVEEDEQ